MEQPQVRIACAGHSQAPISRFVELQGDLKSLSEENYRKLKSEIALRGFSFPVNVWVNEGNLVLLDGHQRIRTLTQMAAEGWGIPEIPYCTVEAQDYKEAKRKLLGAASQYGKIEEQGLYEFMQDMDLPAIELKGSFALPEIDLEKFSEGWLENKEPSQKESFKEFSEDSFSNFQHQCPRCGFQFNDSSSKNNRPLDPS